jgi:hypothetical protein
MTTLHEGHARAESQSVGELLRDLANDSTRLVRDELNRV